MSKGNSRNFLKKRYSFSQDWNSFLNSGTVDLTTNLNELFNNSLSDKGIHGYAEIYSRILLARTFHTIIEYGIGATSPLNNSNSLRIWKKISPNSNIVGFDKDESKLFTDNGITTFQLDQTKLAEIHDVSFEIINKCRGKNLLIIDDGLHEPQAFFNVLRVFSEIEDTEALLIIEDLRITYVIMLHIWNYFFGPRSNGAIFTFNKRQKITRVNNLFSIIVNCRNWNNVYILSNFQIVRSEIQESDNLS